MTLCDKIGSVGKKTLTAATLFSSLFFGGKAANAQESPKTLDTVVAELDEKPAMIARTLLFDIITAKPMMPGEFANPLDGYDKNTKAWYSTTQFLGRASDVLGTGLDESLLGRISQGLVIGYFNEATSYYFHEMAHDYEKRKDGAHSRYSPKLDFLDWHRGFPEYIKTGDQYWNNWNAAFEEDRYVRDIVNGLNQEEFQAHFLFDAQNDKGRITFDEAITFLTAKTADIVYLAVRNTLVGIRVDEDFDYNALPGPPQGVLANDIDEYLFHLHRKGIYRQYQAGTPIAVWDNNAKGIELSRKQLLMQFVVADLLSLRTLESIYAFGNYLVTGKRSIDPIKIKFGNVQMTPPIVNCYMTKNGIFYNSIGLVELASVPFEVSFGTDIDTWLGPGKVRHVRTGVQCELWHVDDKDGGVFIKPFVYVGFDKHEHKYSGYSAGAEIGLGQKDMFEFSIKAEQNENDMLENRIKGKEKGLTISAGFRISY